MSCSVPGCSNSRRFKPQGVSFHTFPRSFSGSFSFPRGELLKSWLSALGKDIQTWTWTKNKLVCSKHFKNEDFIVKGGKRVLKFNAVPHSSQEDSQSTIDVPSTSMSLSQNFSATSGCSSVIESQASSLEDNESRSLKRKLSEKEEVKQQESSTSSGSSAKRGKIAFVKAIHSYSISPRKLKMHNVHLKQRQEKYKKSLYTAKQQISKLKKEITTLKTAVKDLKQQNFISDYAVEHLENSYGTVPHLLMSRYLKNIEKQTTTHETYPPVLREFACMLHFYSNKGYEYVRQEFALALPHQSTIKKWCSNVDCSVGYIEPAFANLKSKVAEASKVNREVICSLMVDEKAIRKQIDFDGTKTWGYIDVGIPSQNDDLQPATEAFVVMVVAHQAHWKEPVAYFLIKSLTGREKANIVNETLIRLNEVGVVITSLTCDGPSANFSMIKELGCDIEDVHNMKTWFLHPADNSQQIFCLMDACHMLKLMRNLLASLEEIKDPEGCIISWKFIKALYDLQEKETLNIANKLKKSHLEWYKQKMKVNLAAQTLSRSVADALEFLDKELHMPAFYGCEATVKFIRRVDKLFDILNSRSPRAKEFKAPLRRENEEKWRPFLMKTIQYLLYCTDAGGKPLWSTPRTAVIGFVISSLSGCGIFDEFVKKERLHYLLSYKCSQDHLEMFFCMVRSRNGWNNNPSALQFMRTFKKLLLHSNISGKGGNCRVLDTTTVLTIPSTSTKKDSQSFDVSLYRKYNLEIAENLLHDHDYNLIANSFDLSELSANVVTYISGYVVKMLHRSQKCADCLEACGVRKIEDDSSYTSSYKLLFQKNRGGLYIPTPGVSTICITTEADIRRVLYYTDYKLPEEVGFINFFVTAVAQKFYVKIYELFPQLQDHFLETPCIEENHGFILVKEIIKAYTKIRFYSLAKRYTAMVQGTLIRKELSKLILFNHQ